MGNSCTNSKVAPPNSTHTIHVKTGDKKGAGVDGNIFLSVEDIDGNISEEKCIDTKWYDDFEAGNTDIYHLEYPNLKKTKTITVRRDDKSPEDLWFLEKVVIEHLKLGKKKSIFPVHRWIGASESLSITEYDCVLPQDDKNSTQRQAELEKKRRLYRLKGEEGMPKQVEEFPGDESFSNDYQWDIVKMKAELMAKTKYVDLLTPKFKTLKDFEKVYKLDVLPIPYGQNNWQSDAEFGNQRLSGCNPTVIELCTQIPEHMPVSAEMLKPFLEGHELDDCISKKKIYILDYRYLANIKCSMGRKIPGPTCIFYVNKKSELVPIAIQLQPEAADDNPIFLPNDGYVWLVAKIWFNLADVSHHQSVTHLGFTHLIMESVAACSHRQLSPSHPIFRLLAPHFIFLIAINTHALAKLVSEGGWVDRCMQIGREGMFNIIKENWTKWNLQGYGVLKGDLKRRGVDDTEALPNYHYRDDALLLWDAMEKYVRNVIEAYYDDANIAADTELQAWATELASVAQFEGIPEKLTSMQQAIEVITTFMFIGSVGHAAANFSQYDEYGFPPNYPAMLFGEPPKSKAEMKEEDIVELLPEKEMVLSVLVVTKLLSARGTNELTNFETQYAYEPKTLDALEQFKAELKKVGATIEARNKTRLRKYPYLHPREVPNAISI